MRNQPLYPKNRSLRLDPRLFRNPTSEYRGAPFWSWNTRIDIPQLLRQIDTLGEMGFGGFNIHSRTGLATVYLGKAFMDAVRACTKKASKEKMLCWLYDEDRWPSGYAGGFVTCEKQHRVKYLLWTQTPYGPNPPARTLSDYTAPRRSEDGGLLARFEVHLKNGYLARYRRLNPTELPKKGAALWHAYLESPMESTWFNGQTYVDTLSRRAIQRFIETTHERFLDEVGSGFGKTIPAIFTDEPQFTKKTQFGLADETRDLFMPFTTDFPDTYRATYKQDLLDHLPELFWNLPDNQPSVARYRYHDHIAERFAEAFGDTLGNWCGKHNLKLTGHMLGEAQLHSQTRGVGEAMRGLRGFQIPGIDILCDKPEYATCKQAVSVARQYGREGVLSEMYGVTNWDYDFVGHKAQGDWQAAMGVTVRVPHLAWVSMAGESKRDYPAAIGHQSPWYQEYPLVEDHFARLNTALTRGKPIVRVAVIHPIESSWLHWGPVQQNRNDIQQLETIFADITRWLAFAPVDFDYISEALLPTQSPRQTGKTFIVGKMRYDVVIVPSLRTIRSTTLRRLEAFAAAGGTVIFAGNVPTLVDAAASAAPARLAKRCMQIQWNQVSILNAVESFKDIRINLSDGSPGDSFLYQLRQDGKDRFLFLVNTDRLSAKPQTQIRLHGKYEIHRLDTMTGETKRIACEVIGGETIITWNFDAHDHLLLRLKSGGKTFGTKPTVTKWTEIARLDDPVPVTLSEPNVLLLDQAEWRINTGKWQPLEEILRLDNLARTQLGLKPRTGRDPQPWADTSPSPVVGELQLRYTIVSDVAVESPLLALENASITRIELDGQPVANHITAWWVDEAIQTVRLPSFEAGTHELLLTIPMTRKSDVEACYLLGDFGVVVAGRRAKLVAPVKKLAFGDWTIQGLPFYAGNVTYHCTAPVTADAMLEVAKFKSPLLSVDVNRKLVGKIAFAPFRIDLGEVRKGARIDITAFGNRVNTFGAVHNADERLTWFGPGAWRPNGADFAYEYQLKPMGILAAPRLLEVKT